MSEEENKQQTEAPTEEKTDNVKKDEETETCKCTGWKAGFFIFLILCIIVFILLLIMFFSKKAQQKTTEWRVGVADKISNKLNQWSNKKSFTGPVELEQGKNALFSGDRWYLMGSNTPIDVGELAQTPNGKTYYIPKQSSFISDMNAPDLPQRETVMDGGFNAERLLSSLSPSSE